MVDAITEARACGVSWRRIGALIGVTGQSVRGRYARLVGERVETTA